MELEEPVMDRPWQEALRGIRRLAAAALRAGPKRVRSGEFLADLLLERFRARWEETSAEDLRRRFPGLDKDSIADRLIAMACVQAGLAGAAAGAAASAHQLASLAGGGLPLVLSTPLATASIGAEVAYTRLVYLDLVVSLARLYDCDIDIADPEAALPVVGLVLGAKGGLDRVVVGTLRDALAHYSATHFVGRRLLPKTLPVASVAIGAALNVAGAAAIGKLAKERFRHRLKGP